MACPHRVKYLCMCPTTCLCALLCSHVVNMYTLAEDWDIPLQIIVMFDNKTFPHKLTWMILLTLDCKYPYLHVQLVIQILFPIFLPSPASLPLHCSSFVWGLNVCGCFLRNRGRAHNESEKEGLKRKTRAALACLTLRPSVVLWDESYEARAQVDNAKRGITACLNFNMWL